MSSLGHPFEQLPWLTLKISDCILSHDDVSKVFYELAEEFNDLIYSSEEVSAILMYTSKLSGIPSVDSFRDEGMERPYEEFEFWLFDGSDGKDCGHWRYNLNSTIRFEADVAQADD